MTLTPVLPSATTEVSNFWKYIAACMTLNGWAIETASVAFVDAASFTVAGDVTATYFAGRQVRFDDSAMTSQVVDAVYTAPSTLVSITGTCPAGLVNVFYEPTIAATPDVVKIALTDSQADFLAAKIVAGDGVVLTALNLPGVGTLQIGLDFGTGSGEVAEGNHTHDTAYAALVHDHATLYAALVHNHSGVYALVAHDHAALYATIAHTHTETYEPADATILKSAAIGVSVQAYDATTLKSAAIGVSIQAYDADTCLSDVAKGYTAQHTATSIALTSASTVSFDNATCALATLTLGHNATLGDPSNKVAGQEGLLIVTGASTYTFSGHANWKLADGTAWAFVPAAGKKTWIWWYCDGTYNWILGSKQEA